MSRTLENAIKAICRSHDNDRTRMMDIVREAQAQFGCVSSKAMDVIAAAVGTHRVEVESVVSFYAYLSKQPKGKVVIRLCNDIIDRMHGATASRRPSATRSASSSARPRPTGPSRSSTRRASACATRRRRR